MTPVGYFFYEAGLLGPCPVKVEADLHHHRSALREHKDRVVSGVLPLDAALWRKPLSVLAKHFPPRS